MEIKISIEHNQKVNTIKREILDVEIVKAILPVDIIQHHLNEMTQFVIEKMKEEFNSEAHR